jgi:hypothetical protein
MPCSLLLIQPPVLWSRKQLETECYYFHLGSFVVMLWPERFYNSFCYGLVGYVITTKFIVLQIVIPEPLVSLVHLFCLYDRHLRNYVSLSMHHCCMHKSCLCYFTKPVAAGNSVVEDSLSPGKMVHPFVVYAALVMYVASVSLHQNSCQLFGKRIMFEHASCHKEFTTDMSITIWKICICNLQVMR